MYKKPLDSGEYYFLSFTTEDGLTGGDYNTGLLVLYNYNVLTAITPETGKIEFCEISLITPVFKLSGCKFAGCYSQPL